MADTPANNTQPTASAPQKGGYGKRPMWQWVLIYVIIAIVVYGGIFYYYKQHHKTTTSNGTTTTTNSLY